MSDLPKGFKPVEEDALRDSDPMPYGKHKGEKLGDVPARYLLWLWDNGKSDLPRGEDAVADYISKNLRLLESECDD